MATCARVSLTARAVTPRRECDDSAGKARAARSIGRRGVLGAGSLAFLAPSRESRAADLGSVSLSPGGIGEPLRPLAEYRAALDRAAAELDAIARDLRDAAGLPRDVASDASTRDDDDDLLFLDLPAAAPPLAPAARAAFKTRLHADELGAFWVTSRGTDRYVSAARSPFARDREDLWKLLPERSGPLGKILQPDFDNPDDPLCLVYSCVNDPRAPPSIDVLYALKLLDEGLATDGVTATGLLANAEDAADKLRAYVRLVDAEADPELRDDAWRNPAPARGWGRVGI